MASPPDPASLPPPIFVLGLRPADTALVGAIVGRNPDAFGLPELNLFVSPTLEGLWLEMPNQRHGQTHIHGLLRALAYIYGGEQTIVSVGMAQRWMMRRLHWPTNRVFDELRNCVAPLRLVDKSSVYSQRPKCLQRVRADCPDAFYVHVVDHPLTVNALTAPARTAPAKSKARRVRRSRPGDKSKQNQDEQLHWLEGQRRIAEATADVPAERRAVLRMEDLITDPRLTLAALCKSLGLDSDPVAIAAMQRPQDSPFSGMGPVGANLGDDPAFLRHPAFPNRPKELAPQTEMRAEVAEFAAAYGYD